MSLNNYLSETYGSKKSSKSKSKQGSNSARNVNIVDSPQQIVFTDNNRLNSKSKDPKKKKTGLWKNLDTNEIVDVKKEEPIKMSSGASAGLQSAEDVARQIKEKQERDKLEAGGSGGGNQSTVFRDESGRVIENYDAYRKEKALRNDLQKRAKERKLAELNMSDIQLYQKKNPGWKGTIDDKDNLKTEDPIIAFTAENGKQQVKTSPLGRKLYEGIYPENRFGIAPGWRWDGVDRSTGFERKWFAKQNEINEKQIQDYTLQRD
ncbi:HHL155Cp [Eremothecium sinecaudum]|uniref:Pre-mRNA-splicing factor CWC26 n=1 Tax=Eremothecium sinecaudum TaxID=45286 RepID=A0A0X8HW81_9SACH|nr:HHL155Cp [Eremothecium sinecaudum]AMD22615.1 HHL155Cp [Eremothecium sinecaudum]